MSASNKKSPTLVASAHGRALRLLADHHGRHFEGLQQAIRITKATRGLPQRLAKQLLNPETSFNVLRHNTAPYVDVMIRDLESALAVGAQGDNVQGSYSKDSSYRTGKGKGSLPCLPIVAPTVPTSTTCELPGDDGLGAQSHYACGSTDCEVIA